MGIGWDGVTLQKAGRRPEGIVKSHSCRHLLRACAGLCAKPGGVGVGESQERRGPRQSWKGRGERIGEGARKV